MRIGRPLLFVVYFFSSIVNVRAFLGLQKKESAARMGGAAGSSGSRGFPFSAVVIIIIIENKRTSSLVR